VLATALDPRTQPRTRDQLGAVRGGRLLRRQHLGSGRILRWPNGPHARGPLLL